jgi:hypothetical protein
VAAPGGGGEVSNFDGFSRAYVVKQIRPSAEFLEGWVGLPKFLGGGDPPKSMYAWR